MREIWKPVLGYEALYKVSNLGRLKSLGNDKSRKEKILKGRINNKGYLHYCLSKNGKSKFYLAHRLVWEAFRYKIPDGLVINHLDSNPLNNCLSNLECVTQQKNMEHAYRIRVGLFPVKQPKCVITFASTRKASNYFGYINDVVGVSLRIAEKNKEEIVKFKNKEYRWKCYSC